MVTRDLLLNRLILLQPVQEGSESGGEARKNDYVEYDQDFIDDTEVFDYYGGDRRKTKHSGFFINKARCLSLILLLHILVLYFFCCSRTLSPAYCWCMLELQSLAEAARRVCSL